MTDHPQPTSPDDAWKQTVRAIYNEMHFGADSVFKGQQRLAAKVVAMIEERHQAFFCEAVEAKDARSSAD